MKILASQRMALTAGKKEEQEKLLTKDTEEQKLAIKEFIEALKQIQKTRPGMKITKSPGKSPYACMVSVTISDKPKLVTTFGFFKVNRANAGNINVFPVLIQTERYDRGETPTLTERTNYEVRISSLEDIKNLKNTFPKYIDRVVGKLSD